MRHPKTKNRPNNPQVTVFSRNPENLKRQESTNAQKNYQDDTIIYGEDDALPLRIAQAVEESPATSSCLETVAQFIKGSGFSNPELQKIKIDEAGTTLWDLHCTLSDSISIFWGFSVNLKFGKTGKITRAYQLSFESCRFKKPEDGSPYIKTIVYNPYFGVDALYKKEFTKEYPVYTNDPKELTEQMGAYKDANGKNIFPGQVYYYGKTSPLSRFYPKPKYWSAKKWIYIDGRIQEAHAENLDNGWFQSVLMNVIGNPSEMSTNPKYQKTYTDEAGVERKKSTHTKGEEFNDVMSETFSGSKKMGTVQVHWSQNETQSTKIQAFPTNTNADLFLALQELTTKNITIATRVLSILANISEGVSLGSGGSEMQKAVEIQQSRATEWQMVLENFYNDVLVPNLAQGASTEKVKIVAYNPITVPVEIEDKFWNVLDDREKRNFVRQHFPSTGIKEEEPKTDSEGNTLPEEGIEIKDNMINLTGKQQQQFLRIIRQFGQGKLNEAAATIQLKGFGFKDQEVRDILGLDEMEVTVETPTP